MKLLTLPTRIIKKIFTSNIVKQIKKLLLILLWYLTRSYNSKSAIARSIWSVKILRLLGEQKYLRNELVFAFQNHATAINNIKIMIRRLEKKKIDVMEKNSTKLITSSMEKIKTISTDKNSGS